MLMFVMCIFGDGGIDVVDVELDCVMIIDV